jgi:hypothetical protein
VIWITSPQKRSLLQRSRRSDKCLRGNLDGESERRRMGCRPGFGGGRGHDLVLGLQLRPNWSYTEVRPIWSQFPGSSFS